MKKKICVVTGSRAEYGLLKWVMKDIADAEALSLQVVVTGMHLVSAFGNTYREILADGFRIDRQVDILMASDGASGVAKSMGMAMIGFADAFEALAPDAILVLGDRFEILAVASAALVHKIPVIHLHGGEKTEGAIDDSIRHAITKMSHLHFVAAEEYRSRVLQLGEQPDRVFMVGGLGVDSLVRTPLLDKETLSREIGFDFGKRNLLVTYHPETLSDQPPETQFLELLRALRRFPEINVIFTYPNADMGGQAIARLIEDHVASAGNCRGYQSLGHKRYLSCLQFVDGVVGNSSSGLLEVPTFRKGTVNIGQRQAGRLKAESVIDCDAEEASIVSAIERLYSPDFLELLETARNPYGDGGASAKIVSVLTSIDWDALLSKSFVDLPG